VRTHAAVSLATLLLLGARPATPEIRYTSGQPALDELQGRIRTTLQANRKVFTGRTGRVTGFGAGAAYPQIWLRDSATLVGTSRYLCPAECLTSWIEEHLAHQRPDGSLFDWVAAGEPERFREWAPRVVEAHRAGALVVSADKNTSETDQESSAVLAASDVFAALGDRAWLARPIAGRPLLARLDAALTYVLDHRWDRATGLVTAAFTADWGDVTPVHGDQRAIYRDKDTPVVAALYPSALFVQAATGLARLHRASGDAPGAVAWDARARRMSAAIDATLWQEARGFYRMHRVLSWPGRPPAAARDADIFAMGGHAVALRAGVGTPARAARVFGVAAARAKAHGMPTISGVLLPPYPDGFFKHPIMSQAFTYQNGGQWDWWGARFVLAAFQRGDAAYARRELGRVAEQAARTTGLHEWTSRDGQGQGSATYAGTAAALGQAILEGLFGIDLRAERLDLHVRLGTENASVEVEEPATRRAVRYRYVYDPAARSAVLEYSGTGAGAGTLDVLLPSGTRLATGAIDGGRARTLEIRRVGLDRYARLRTDWASHRLEIKFR
jgi:hypothetical protein